MAVTGSTFAASRAGMNELRMHSTMLTPDTMRKYSGFMNIGTEDMK
jgi:hypothetical protein